MHIEHQTFNEVPPLSEWTNGERFYTVQGPVQGVSEDIGPFDMKFVKGKALSRHFINCVGVVLMGESVDGGTESAIFSHANFQALFDVEDANFVDPRKTYDHFESLFLAAALGVAQNTRENTLVAAIVCKEKTLLDLRTDLEEFVQQVKRVCPEVYLGILKGGEEGGNFAHNLRVDVVQRSILAVSNQDNVKMDVQTV